MNNPGYIKSSDNPPTMPQVILRAKWVEDDKTTAHRVTGQEYVKWTATLTYRVMVSPRARAHDEQFVWTGVAPLSGEIAIDWNAMTGWNFLTQLPTVIPTPTPFIGGGELVVFAQIFDSRTEAIVWFERPRPRVSGHTRPDDQLTFIVRPDGTTQVYQASHSPGSMALRIEGQLSFVGGSARAGEPVVRQDTAKLDPQLLDTLVTYLRAPIDVPTNPPRPADQPSISQLAMDIQGYVTESTDIFNLRLHNNFFRLIAYHEGRNTIRHFNDLTLWCDLADRAQVPKEAVWPLLSVVSGKNCQTGFRTDGGYGQMQLTNPPATYEQVWDYRKNTNEAITRLAEKIQLVDKDVARLTKAPYNLSISTEDKRFALYKKYNGEGRPVVPYLNAEFDLATNSYTLRPQDSPYTDMLRKLEARIKQAPAPTQPGQAWPGFPPDRWGPTYPGE